MKGFPVVLLLIQHYFGHVRCCHFALLHQLWTHRGDNHIQNDHLGRYIVGYTVANLVLQRPASGAVKRDLRPYIRRYTSQNDHFEYGYPHPNVLLQSRLKLEHCKLHKAARHPTKCDVINDAKLFPTVYRRIYCRKFLMLSNQTTHYKSKGFRIRCR